VGEGDAVSPVGPAGLGVGDGELQELDLGPGLQVIEPQVPLPGAVAVGGVDEAGAIGGPGHGVASMGQILALAGGQLLDLAAPTSRR